MHHRTTACFLILLLLCCGLKCNTDVARVVLPELTDTSETTPLFAMEAILATRGEVHSPIPDAVYDALWGHWTEVGLSAPRDYYTKYIDADGIAIVGGDLVDDRFFQAARHIALVMTAKLPGLREALSHNQPGGINGEGVPFRFVLTEHFSKDVENLPEYANANIDGIKYWLGSCGPLICRADVAWPPDEWGYERADMIGMETIIHEMTHAIQGAIVERNLVPNFVERLEAAFDKEMDKVRLRTEIDGEPYIPYTDADGNIVRIRDLPEWDRPPYCTAIVNSHDHSSEMWAWFVEHYWFDSSFDPVLRSYDPYRPIDDFFRPECPNLVSITEEVFPAFPLHWAISTQDYFFK